MSCDNSNAKRIAIKIPFYFLGLVISTCGTAIITTNALGSNAMNTLFTAVAVKLNMPPGNIYTIFNSTFLIVGFILARRYMGIASVLMILLQGWLINSWMLFFQNRPYLFIGIPMKGLMMLASYIFGCAGIGLSTSMCLGTAGFEACLFRLADRIKVEYKYLKMISEVLFFAAALFLNGVYGIMTIIEVLFFGHGVSYFIMLYNRTFLKKLGIADERNELSRNRRTRKGTSP